LDSDARVSTSGEFRILNLEDLWLEVPPWDVMEMGITYRMNGHTNLPAGTIVQVNITEYENDPSSRANITWVFTRTVTVERESVTRNLWACAFPILPPVHPGNYSVSACSVQYPGVCSVTSIPVVPARYHPSTSSLAGAASP
jgi:hypothetical protein